LKNPGILGVLDLWLWIWGTKLTDQASNTAKDRIYTAALVIIGNEVLSGRTKDANTGFLGERLNALGVRLLEVRIVRDDYAAIAEAVNALRARSDYVFTTGGIGPTHDDITAEAIARAFGVKLIEHPEAIARLERHYASSQFTPARRRMARVPEGATLIDNPVSAAPGFRVENVMVMAGVPKIMQAMFDGIAHELTGGAPLLSRTVRTNLPEGRIAESLGVLQEQFVDIEIGSYPHMNAMGPNVRVVLRGTNRDRLDTAVSALAAELDALGGAAEEVDITVR